MKGCKLLELTYKNNCEHAIEFIGREWIGQEIKKFKAKRIKYQNDSVSSENLEFEYNFHPLIKDIINSSPTIDDCLNFVLCNQRSIGGINLCLLGKDLLMLKNEISKKGQRVQKELKDAQSYSGTRFELAVASAHKTIGINPEFASVNSKKPDLKLTYSNNYFFAECKSRKDKTNDKFLRNVLNIAENIFLNLRDKNIENMFVNLPFTSIKNTFDTNTLNHLPVIHPTLKEKFISWGHFKGSSYLTDLQDSIIISDGLNNNLIIAYKRNRKNTPKFYNDYLDDAIKKDFTDGIPYIVYIDSGSDIEEFQNEDRAKLEISSLYDTYKNSIDLIVVFRSRPFVDGNNKILWGKGLFVCGSKTYSKMPERFFGSCSDDHARYLDGTGLVPE